MRTTCTPRARRSRRTVRRGFRGQRRGQLLAQLNALELAGSVRRSAGGLPDPARRSLAPAAQSPPAATTASGMQLQRSDGRGARLRGPRRGRSRGRAGRTSRRRDASSRAPSSAAARVPASFVSPASAAIGVNSAARRSAPARDGARCGATRPGGRRASAPPARPASGSPSATISAAVRAAQDRRRARRPSIACANCRAAAAACPPADRAGACRAVCRPSRVVGGDLRQRLEQHAASRWPCPSSSAPPAPRHGTGRGRPLRVSSAKYTGRYLTSSSLRSTRTSSSLVRRPS